MRWRHLLLCPLLVACTAHGRPEPSAERAAELYLSIHNDGDRSAARELWATRADTFGEMTDWFRAQVGPCTSFSPMKVHDSLHARFVFDCRAGQLEIEFQIDEDTGAVRSLRAGARGIDPPAHVRRMAEQILALGNGDPVAMPEFAVGFDEDEFDAEMDQLSATGPCKVVRVHLGTVRGGRFVLDCANGPMTMLVDLNAEGLLRRFAANKGAADTWRTQAEGF